MRHLGFLGHAGFLLAASVAVAGCGEMSDKYTSVSSTISATPSAPARARLSSGAPADAAQIPGDEVTKSATAGRKIIYNANVALVTEDLNKFENALTKLIEANKAYVADSDRTGSAGSSRHGSWKVRVPVELYAPFLKAASSLGELVSVKADSQDVSEEFFDLEAREAAKKVEEQRLLKHLTDSTGKLDEILAVERELTRVRSEIERMQGRLRALGNLTTLATVTITASEIKDYVPPQAPTFATRISRTFGESLDNLKSFGEAIALFVVAIAPWLPVLIVVALLVFWIGRKTWDLIPQASPVASTRPPAGPR